MSLESLEAACKAVAYVRRVKRVVAFNVDPGVNVSDTLNVWLAENKDVEVSSVECLQMGSPGYEQAVCLVYYFETVNY